MTMHRSKDLEAGESNGAATNESPQYLQSDEHFNMTQSGWIQGRTDSNMTYT